MPRRSSAAAPVIGAAAVALVLAGRFGGLGDIAVVETFVVIFASIIIEALPFVLLGAMVSAAIEVFVPDEVIERFPASSLPTAPTPSVR